LSNQLYTRGSDSPASSFLILAQWLRAHGYPDVACEFSKKALDWYDKERESGGSVSRQGYYNTLYFSLFACNIDSQETADTETSDMGLIISGNVDTLKSIAEEYLVKNPNSIINQVRYACLMVRLGNREMAEQICDQLRKLDQPDLRGRNMWAQGQIKAVLGDYELASKFYEDGFRENFSYRLEYYYDFDLEGLRKSTRFREFLKSKE